MSWSFDAHTRRFHSARCESVELPLCEHLAPSLVQVSAQGATIVAVLVGAWSHSELQVTLDRGPAVASLVPARPTDPSLEAWKNDDPHYPMEQGLRCPLCRHAIGWPLIPVSKRPPG